MSTNTLAPSENVEATTTSISSKRELTANDRCDRCAAQAYYGVDVSKIELLFCRHHFNAFEPKLVEQGGIVVIDDTYKLAPDYRKSDKDY